MTSVLQPQREAPNGTYTFSSRPRPVPSRLKYREPTMMQNEGQVVYGNIMYDRRVVRGNTYAHQILPVALNFDLILILELYLEELTDHIEDVNVECQTDAFLDKPATPLFIPAKSGKDVATQIEEGELFHFDMEVQPVLEVLVGKTIEQALLEVMEEEELARLRAQQHAFQELRNAELVEVQRLEEQERRRREEKNRRIKQQRAVLEKEKETAEKIAARAFARHYLADLLPSVFTTLRDHGYFYDPVQRDIETGFLPWLMEEVSNALDKRHAALAVLDSEYICNFLFHINCGSSFR
ncbi:hypothetical protein P4O66_019759 [Electrophorus voltai]|uniref:Radial spoke head 3 n=1 Tax=Electrophorus voltai TaxID=2609070 RepID=A0AAD9E5S7_9TELE|nr:hypothetical protein P4O66_019759 [Electrophorus voltai]